MFWDAHGAGAVLWCIDSRMLGVTGWLTCLLACLLVGWLVQVHPHMDSEQFIRACVNAAKYLLPGGAELQDEKLLNTAGAEVHSSKHASAAIPVYVRT